MRRSCAIPSDHHDEPETELTMNTITVRVDLGDNADTFTCDLTDEQLAILLSEHALFPDDEPDTYTFDEDRIGENWDSEEFDATELLALADALLRYPRHSGDLTDTEALDMIAYCLSTPEWSVSFLEDIADIVWRTTHSTVKGAYWSKH